MITHYSSGYAHHFYESFIREYAGFAVSIFFVLSGFGLYYSFNRLRERFDGQPLSLKLAATFFWQRALRIYPLFWLSLITASFLLPFPELHDFSLQDVLTYLAIPTMRHPGYPWFVPALVQCYLAAPFIYYLLDRLGLRRYLVFLAGMCAVFFLISISYTRLDSVLHITRFIDADPVFYRSMFLSNVLLFGAGLAMPLLLERIRPHINNMVTIACLLAFLGTMYSVRDIHFYLVGIDSQMLLFPLFVLSVSAFCLAAIALNARLPLSRAVGYLGTYSFALYLFHWPYYFILSDLGLVNEGQWLGAIYAVVFFPLFLLACVVLQKGATWLKELLEAPLDASKNTATATSGPE